MPLWEIDFSDIDIDTEVPEDIDDDEELPEGYNEEFERVDNFVFDNMKRAKETKDIAMIGFVVEQANLRYTHLGLKKEVLDKQIWITEQLGKGIMKNLQYEVKGSELKTQIAYMEEIIADQKTKETDLRNRVTSLRAERDFKKSRLEAVIRSNRGALNEISHINKRHALIQERLRLDTIEYEREKALRDDLRQTFTAYSEDLDRQLENAPWLVEKKKEAARKKELEDEIKELEADLVKIDLTEERNRIAEASERDLPWNQFCVQLAELYVKREKLFKALDEAKIKVKELEEERRNRRALEDSSQMDCTQAILDGDLDDEETLMKMARHYKIDTQNPHLPISQMTQEIQQTQQIGRKRAPSPAESTASSEANDEDMSDSGEQMTTVAPPPPKRVSVVEPIHNPDESVDEGVAQTDVQKETNLNESRMEENEQSEDRSQPEQMETDEREEEEKDEVDDDDEEEEEEEEQEGDDVPSSQGSQVTVASQESEAAFAPGEVVEQEEVEENDGFVRPSLVPMKVAPAAIEENDDITENGDVDIGFNPEMMLNISASSNDPGGDFFDMMNNQATTKRAKADAAGGSPSAAAGDGDFMSMFAGGGDTAAADGDAASFSFNFGGGGDANETSNGGGGEFNFFGF